MLFLWAVLAATASGQYLSEVACNTCDDPTVTCSSMVSCLNVEYRGKPSYIRVLGKQKSEFPILTEGMAEDGQVFGFWGTLRGDMPFTGVITTFCIFDDSPQFPEGCAGARLNFTLSTDCISQPIFPGLAFGNGAFKIMDGCASNTGLFYPSSVLPAMPQLQCGECFYQADGTLKCVAEDETCPQLSPCTQASCTLQGTRSSCQIMPLQCPSGMVNAGYAAGNTNPFNFGGETSVIPGRRRNVAQYFDQGACCQAPCSTITCPRGQYNINPNQLCPSGPCNTQFCCDSLPSCGDFTCPSGFESIGHSVVCNGACTPRHCCVEMPRCSSVKCRYGFKNVAFFNEDKICRQYDGADMESGSTSNTNTAAPTTQGQTGAPFVPVLEDGSGSLEYIPRLRRVVANSFETTTQVTPFCSHDECCAPTSTCGDRTCGPRAYRSNSLDHICRGNQCPFEECCTPLPICSGQECGYGYVPSFIGQPCGIVREVNPYNMGGESTGADLTAAENQFYQQNPKCSFQDCCAPLPKCADIQCNSNSLRIAPLDHICFGNSCSESECCEEIPQCKNAPCGYGFEPLNNGMKCGIYGQSNQNRGRRALTSMLPDGTYENVKYVPNLDYDNYPRPQPCAFDECCRRLPRCGDLQCGLNSYRTKPESHALLGAYEWSWSSCCADFPKCPKSGDSCGAGFRLKNQGMVCFQPSLESVRGSSSTQTQGAITRVDGASTSEEIPIIIDDSSSSWPIDFDWDGSTSMESGDIPKRGRRRMEVGDDSSSEHAVPVIETRSTSQLWKPDPCSFNECCERIPVCMDIDCGIEAVRIKPLSYQCSGTSCKVEDCCYPRPKCQPTMCSSAFLPINQGRVCGLGAESTSVNPYNLGGESTELVDQRPPPCRLDECCVPKAQCSTITCPSQMYHIAPKHHYCRGTTCKLEECCAPLPSCGVDSQPCYHGYKNINTEKVCPQSSLFESGKYEFGQWNPQPCAFEQCCERLPMCMDIECAYESMRIVAPDFICQEGGCQYEQCCSSLPKCLGAPCGIGFRSINVGQVCNGMAGYMESSQVQPNRQYGRPLDCSFEECCERLPQCGDQQCPSSHYPSAAPGKLLIGGWSVSQCCSELPKCTGQPCGYGWEPINEGMICYQKNLGELSTENYKQSKSVTFLGSALWTPLPCSWSECCKRQPICMDINCESAGGVRSKYPEAICSGGRCTFQECCVPMPKCTGDAMLCGPNAVPINIGKECGIENDYEDNDVWDGSESFDFSMINSGRRRGLAYSLALPPPRACTFEECCQSLPTCGSIVCGAEAYKLHPDTHVCVGDSCSFNQCCGVLPKCDNTLNPCGYGFQPINQGKICRQSFENSAIGDDSDSLDPASENHMVAMYGSNGLWIPAPCSKDECCTRLPQCGDMHCGIQAKKIAADNTVCPGGYCKFEDCCAMMDVCDATRPCGTGFIPVNQGMICKDHNMFDLKQPRMCDKEECCKRLPTCGEVQCGAGQTRKRPFSHECEGSECTKTECCSTLPVCKANLCNPQLFVPIKQNEPCVMEPNPFDAGLTNTGVYEPPACTVEACCLPRATCQAYDCPASYVNVRNNVFTCEGSKCTDQECCSKVDQWGRPNGFGEYHILFPGVCEAWGCARLQSKEECEYSASVLQIPDDEAALATKTTSPGGCYFRPEWQTLWWNEVSDAEGTTERRLICYCPLEVGTPWMDPKINPLWTDNIILDAQPQGSTMIG